MPHASQRNVELIGRGSKVAVFEAMPKPQTPDRGVLFDLDSIAPEMRQESAYHRSGHVARTLVRLPDLRVVFVVMKEGGRMAEHKVDEACSIQVVSGEIQVATADDSVEATTGQVLILEPRLEHSVLALTACSFVLTFGWNPQQMQKTAAIAAEP